MTTPERDRSARSSRRITTRFGDFDVDADQTLTFPSGLPGFEQARQFVVLSAAEMAPLQCLHALDGVPASFFVIDPRLVLPGYRCILTDADRQRLGVAADQDEHLLWFAIVTIASEHEAWVNLRAPVVINPARMVGYQVMPHNSLYPLRHPLALE